MKKKLTISFNELITMHYGRPGHAESGGSARSACGYGSPTIKKRAGRTYVLSLGIDDGETPKQRLVEPDFEEYVVERSMGMDTLEEYVVYESPIGGFPLMASATQSLSLTATAAEEECRVDLFDPLRKFDAKTAATRQADTAALPPLPGGHNDDAASRPHSSSQSISAAGQSSRAEVDCDDFESDIKAILSGQKVFDPATKKTVEKGNPAVKKSGANQPEPEAKNEQAIFDRIAQSMQYANAYDLGTVELENRFSDFDRIDELQKKKPPSEPNAPKKRASSEIDSEDFIRDLDHIRSQKPSAVLPTPAYGYSEQASITPEKLDKVAKDVFGYDSYEDYIDGEMKSCTFCGQNLKNLHGDVVQKLGVVEAALPAGYAAPSVDSTLRKGKSGMHGWGMAMDFNVINNPYVLNEAGESELDKELIAAYDHIVDFILGKAESDIRKLKKGRAAFGGTVDAVYDALREESDAMKRYFELMADDNALQTFLSQEWSQNHTGTAPDLASVKAQMREDYEVLGGKTAAGKRSTDGKGDRPFSPSSSGGKGDPAGGFLNLGKELVVEMTKAGFAWGAIDLGRASGDIMHFDLRLHGTGAKVYSMLIKK